MAQGGSGQNAKFYEKGLGGIVISVVALVLAMAYLVISAPKASDPGSLAESVMGITATAIGIYWAWFFLRKS